jgi:TldD protein
MARARGQVCYLEGSRHRFVVPAPRAMEKLRVYDCQAIRGRIRDDAGCTRIFSGPPPHGWDQQVQTPADDGTSVEVVNALVALVTPWRGRARLHYSRTISSRLTLTPIASAPIRTSSAWAVTGWLLPALGGPFIPVGWSGRGSGQAWLEGAASAELQWLARAVESAGTMPAASPPSVLAPGAAAVLLHEAIGHRAEAAIAGRPHDARALGRRVASELLSAWDDPLAPDAPAHYEYDDENVRVLGATALVDEGILVAQLHSPSTAAAAGTLPTANGRSASAWDTPIPRVSNLMCGPGLADEETAIARAGRGLYIWRVANGVNNGVRVEAEIVLAERIDNGERTGSFLTGGRISENLDLLLRVVDVADKPTFHSNAICGKAGQLLFDVGTFAPAIGFSSLRIVA